MLPSAEQIQQEESKARPLPIEPWVAIFLSRVWKDLKQNIQGSIAAGTLVQPQSAQSAPASAHNHS
jgi:hypothetical protein